jgi:hypothetical protein
MTSIFHYTNVDGLLGILSSEALFATDYRYLNDASEARSIRDLILPILSAEIAAITPKLIEKGWLKKEYYEELGSQANLLQAEHMYRAFIRGLDATTPFFVTSFCTHAKDSEEFKHGLLSQWRGYGQSGGFAIEFDEPGFGALMKEENEKYAYAVLQSDNVHYEQHEANFDPKAYSGVAGEMIFARIVSDDQALFRRRSSDFCFRLSASSCLAMSRLFRVTAQSSGTRARVLTFRASR